MSEKKRYSDEELEEFKTIINEKLRLARRDYDAMMRQIMNQDGNDVDDTSPTYKALVKNVQKGLEYYEKNK